MTRPTASPLLGPLSRLAADTRRPARVPLTALVRRQIFCPYLAIERRDQRHQRAPRTLLMNSVWHSRDVILLRPEDIKATLEPNVCAAGIYSTRIPELSVGTIGKNRAALGTGLGFAAQAGMRRILCLIPLLFLVIAPVAADPGNPQGQEHSQAGGRGWARGRGHVGQEQRVAVPEPSSLALFGVGALTVLIRRRRAGRQM